MKNIRVILLLLALLATASCAWQAPQVSVNAKPNQQAILYGQFNISHVFAFKYKLALWLQNLDTQKPVYIFFDADQPLQAIRVKPGRYQLVGLTGVNRLNEIKCRYACPPNAANVPFTVPTGTAIYLGNFAGSVTCDSVMVVWKISGSTNSFADTTQQFYAQHPKLRAVPTTSAFEQLSGADWHGEVPVLGMIPDRAVPPTNPEE